MCKGHMGVKENEKCVINDDDDDDETSYVFASLQCEEGLGCVPSKRGGKDGTCQKITAKRGEKTCTTDEDCPSDSFCDCNDEKGQNQCIPYPSSSKELMTKVENAASETTECIRKYREGTFEYTECYIKSATVVSKLMNDKFLNYKAEFRCTFSSEGAASTIKVSIFALVAVVLLALF